VCNGAVCGTTCGSDGDCASGNYCNTTTSTCTGQVAKGQACTANDQCASNSCLGGYCCTSPCVTAGSCGASGCASVSGQCLYPGTSDAPASLQTQGDCQQVVCNGSGGTTTENDSANIPTSVTACLIDPSCCGTSTLAPCFTDAATGTNCRSDGTGGNVCGDTSNSNIAGTCVECNTNSDCLYYNPNGTLTCNPSTGTCQ
jgi:hypothetical protein